MAETHIEKFKKLLAELFMFDQADLDFGIYRIMNAKRDEITRFLDTDLLPQVREALGELEKADRSVIEAELAKAIDQAKALGADPESLPKVKELRQHLAHKGDLEALEREVFSDLYNFFRRYYSEGDFLSLRRYKQGVYAIPYEGEEVKLHWANADQYYIKTAEYFRDYTFKLPDGRRVHFRLADADTEQNNNKPANGQERRFILRGGDPVAEVNGELVVHFQFRPDPEKRKQTDLNELAARQILEAQATRNWLAALATKSPTERNPNRTLLDRHLSDYTARNTFDYFIHKDLGGFLRRELDFFIKNEVMHLDDIESESGPRVEQYLARVRAIRRIGSKIIDFLAQIENFQKKLWLKKKFVIETNYCMTLDRVPEDLYPEVAANGAQREEWVRLLGIDSIRQDLHTPGYSDPLSVEFLRANPYLPVDTAYFCEEFRRKLLSSIANLDAAMDGVLIQADNFHGLNLLKTGLQKRIGAIYIDPPYNTDATQILYKNDYKHSSWLALIQDRLDFAKVLLSNSGIICVTIDDLEVHYLWPVLVAEFGAENHLGTAAIRNNPQGRSTLKGMRVNHEYAFFFALNDDVRVGRLERSEQKSARWDQTDEAGSKFLWENFRKTGTDSRRKDRPKQFYPVYWDGRSVRIPRMTWVEESEEWLIEEQQAANEKTFWPLDDNDEERVWKWGSERVLEHPEYLRVNGEQGKEQLYCRNYLNTEGRLPATWWDDAKYAAGSHGTNLLTDMFGKARVFDFPKSVYAVEDCLRVANAGQEAIILDYFGGSGTTAHAVINLNRSAQSNRRYVLIEAGHQFDDVLKPRVLKSAYSSEWDKGRPVSRSTGISQTLKYLRLESYEDSLNNLELKRTREQGELLVRNPALREDYVLRYMLDVESQDSASLLDLNYFEDPFDYKLKVGTGSAGETQLANVDLIETFNWLLGLRVRHLDTIRGFRVVQGTSPSGEKVLLIWRDIREKSNAELDEFFLKQGYNTRDMEFDLIYVNGDNNLENLKRPDETWKVRLIEEEFKRLMFDVRDV